MAGLASRNKGKRGEREVVKLLQPVVDRVFSARGLEVPVLYRNQNQSFQGGYDIDGIDWLALEVKRQEQLNINTWWKQTISQASPSEVPVLIYKQNHKPWKVIMIGYLDAGTQRVKTRVEIDLETFLIYFETKMANVLDNGR
jgi:2,4-dienoyl-CoA reductase-like NADH-dependent reductase (Old Yellow Enzyme family)